MPIVEHVFERVKRGRIRISRLLGSDRHLGCRNAPTAPNECPVSQERPEDLETRLRDLDMRDFDGRGMHLSRELQSELGSAYRVDYHFTFAGGRDRWMPLVEGVPCPGWTAS